MYGWQKTRYSVYKTTIHLVFVVKYRKKVLTQEALVLLENVFAKTCQKLACTLLAFGGEADHVHLLVSLSPKVAICKWVGRLKGFSSFELKRTLGKTIRKILWGKNLWRSSYCVVSCGGASLDVVKNQVRS